jgi:hypothetical protein
VRFYTEIAPTIEMRIPRCHFAAIDDAGAHVTLLLEGALLSWNLMARGTPSALEAASSPTGDSAPAG